MQNNNIIIAENEKIFLEFAKNLDIKNIKTNEDIIIWEKERKNSEWEDENIIIIYWKNVSKTIDFIKSNYILIEKIFLAGISNILSNGELKVWDIIIPNTFISKTWETKFLDNTTIWKDYDMKKFWLMLSGISSETSWENSEFQADIKSENSFTYLKFLESENLLEKTIVVSQIWEEDFTNLVAVVDMMV